METALETEQPGEHVVLKRLWWAGPLTILAAILANMVIRLIAIAVLQPDPRFVPLQMGTPIVFTFFGVLGAVITFAFIGHFSSRPIWLFRRIAVVVLFLTYIPDTLMLMTGFNPGTTTANVLTLMLMHTVSWAICVLMLPGLTRE